MFDQYLIAEFQRFNPGGVVYWVWSSQSLGS